MLRYTPRGVTRPGWHTIAVTVPKSRSFTVRARTGYGIEEVRPAPLPPAISATPRTLPELTTAYERGAYQSVVMSLRQVADPARLLRDFLQAGNPWPATPRREAAFAIDLAEPGAFSSRAATREDAQKHLERFARLIRHPLEPEAFERHWYYAVLTLLQGAIRPGVTEVFADRALARFPDEPRFLLARAVAADQRTAVSSASPGSTTRSLAPVIAEAVRQRYEAALKHPEVSVEARLRLAWLLYRTGRHPDALAKLEEPGTTASPDPALRYLHRLFLGHVLGALDRPDEAIEAYRAALAIVPLAQSARVALMNAFLSRGDRAEAEALAERVQAERPADLDPWWMYWQGQYRLYPQAMARVRELIR